MARLPGDSTLKTEYAGLLVRMDRPDQAMAQYRELAALGLVDKKAWIEAQMAALYETRGDIPQAIRHYRQAYESEPENDDYARKLAYLLHRSQRLAEALEVYLALERRQPEDIQLIRDLAILYAQLNELERARGYFTRALRSAPDANLYFNLRPAAGPAARDRRRRCRDGKVPGRRPAWIGPGRGRPPLPVLLAEALRPARPAFDKTGGSVIMNRHDMEMHHEDIPGHGQPDRDQERAGLRHH